MVRCMTNKKSKLGSVEKILKRPARDGVINHYQTLKGYAEKLYEFDALAGGFIEALYGDKGVDGATAIGAIRAYHDKIVSELGRADEIKEKDSKDSGEYLDAIKKEKEVVGEMLNVGLIRAADLKNEIYASINKIEGQVVMKKEASAKAEAEYKALEKQIEGIKETLKGVESLYKEFVKLGKSLTF